MQGKLHGQLPNPVLCPYQNSTSTVSKLLTTRFTSENAQLLTYCRLQAKLLATQLSAWLVCNQGTHAAERSTPRQAADLMLHEVST